MARDLLVLAAGATAIVATLFATSGFAGEHASGVCLVLGAGIALVLSRAPRRG